MRRETGEGLGGTLVLLPFVLGVSAPLFIADGSIAVGCALSGLGWILAMQYWWLCRVNELYCSRFDDDRAPPLTPTWAFIPPLNVVVGLRGIHFLAIANGGTAEDPVTKWFPFLGVERLGLTELVTSPKLWVSFGGGKKGGETEKER